MQPARSNPFARERQRWLTLTLSAASLGAFAVGWAVYGRWAGDTGESDTQLPSAETVAPDATAGSAATATPPPSNSPAAPAASATRKSRAS